MITTSNVTIMVADLDRSIRFYTDILGLSLKRRFAYNWAEIEAPGIVIGLHPAKSAASSKPVLAPIVSVGFGVDDLYRTMQELKGRGVAFTYSKETENMAFFNDPDGTPLYLREFKS